MIFINKIDNINKKMAKKILKEAFNIKNGQIKTKDGRLSKIAYVDKATSENTFNAKDIFKKYKAYYRSDMKTWVWYLGNNPQMIYKNYIQPCLEELTKIEDKGQGSRQEKVTQIIDELIKELSGNVASVNLPNAREVTEALVQFKADLLNCVTSEEFMNRMEPIIKFQRAQGRALSLKNSILIIFQDPEATMVKSETGWSKVNRIVTDKSKPIILFRPDKEPLSKEQRAIIRNKFLADAGVQSTDELDPGQKEELNVQLSGGKIKQNMHGRPIYKNYYGYDVRFTTQMEGKEDLVGNNEGNKELEWYDKSTDEFEQVEVLMNATLKVCEESGIKIQYVPLDSLGGALGVACGDGTIKLPDNQVYTQNAIATCWHEILHQYLHLKYLKNKGTDEFSQFFIGTEQGRGLVEQQAELGAWITCKYFNFDRIQSLNYVGSWGGLKDAKQAARLFDMVSAASSFLIKKVSSYIPQATREINNNEDNIEEYD